MNPRIYALSLALLLTACSSETKDPHVRPASSADIRVVGRTAVAGDSITLGYPGTEIVAQFTGSSARFQGEVLGSNGYFNASIDGQDLPRIDLDAGAFDVTLASDLDPNQSHTLRLVRRNEAWHGLVRIDRFKTDGAWESVPAAPSDTRRILCIGDSITCGEATELRPPEQKANRHWNAERSYGWFLAKDFGAQVNLVSYGGKGLTRDWAGLKEPVKAPEFFERALPDDPEAKWDHVNYQPDVVLICLGTNDFSKGIVDRDTFVSAYTSFVERIHEVHPKAKVLLVSSPWFAEGTPKRIALDGYLSDTAKHFVLKRQNFVHWATFSKTYEGTTADMHPTDEQHREMANDLAPSIKDWLGW